MTRVNGARRPAKDSGLRCGGAVRLGLLLSLLLLLVACGRPDAALTTPAPTNLVAAIDAGSKVTATLPITAKAEAAAVRPTATGSLPTLTPSPPATRTPPPLPTPTPAMAEAYPESAYPAPVTRSSPAPYPGPRATSTPAAVPPALVTRTAGPGQVFLPFAPGPPATPTLPPTPTMTPTPLPTLTPAPTPTPTPAPALDFEGIRGDLIGQGQELAFNKIGFHVTLPEDRELLDDWMRQLDAAGVPIFLKTVDNAEPLYKAQQLRKASGVPHVLVFRSTGSVPFYDLPPEQAAQLHWEFHRDAFPPELDPSLVWIETLNEVDRSRPEWLGRFALKTAELALADGFKWAAFSWASGEPEPEQWQSPAMLQFLRLAGDNPERLAIAVHEYSFKSDEIDHDYPHKVGRFLELFRIADRYGIPRPTVLITEFGWEYDNVPTPAEALRDVEWAARLYAPFPEVKGAAIWNLGIGCCFGDISEQVQQLIAPLTEFSLSHYFAVPPPPAPLNADLYAR